MNTVNKINFLKLNNIYFDKNDHENIRRGGYKFKLDFGTGSHIPQLYSQPSEGATFRSTTIPRKLVIALRTSPALTPSVEIAAFTSANVPS